MKPPSLHLATPAFGNACCTEFAKSIAGLAVACGQARVDLTFDIIPGLPIIDLARNYLVHAFLQGTTASHLLFVDADQGFAPRDILNMLAANLEVVCGIVPIKEHNWSKVAEAAAAGERDPDALRDASLDYATECAPGARASVLVTDFGRFAEIKSGGTGVMLVKRGVFEKMIEHYGDQLTFYPPGLRDSPCRRFFECELDPETREYLTEDYAFSRRWRAMGGKVYGALDARITHHTGVAVFAGNPSRLFKAPAVPEAQVPMQSPSAAVPSRNGPCPCGSGRKYKRCHGEQSEVSP